MSRKRTLIVGEQPPKGAFVELCRLNVGPGASTVIETFTADGTWTAPPLLEGFFYRATTMDWDDEGLWNAVFGPHETRESVQNKASERGLTVEAYAGECADEALSAGATFDRAAAVTSLVRQVLPARSKRPPGVSYLVSVGELRLYFKASSIEDAALQAARHLAETRVLALRVTGDPGKSGRFQGYVRLRGGDTLNSIGPEFHVMRAP